jgi:dolichol kinase
MIYYAFIENCRFTGGLPFFNLAGVYIVKIAIFASHRRDKNRFILGPLTLGAGALYALLFFDSGSAAAAIYALAFGDGFAGLVGCVFGRIRPRFLKGKSLEGSIACFTAILISSMLVTHDFTVSFICAVTGTIIEALPIEDFDNVFLPLAIGAVLALVGAP